MDSNGTNDQDTSNKKDDVKNDNDAAIIIAAD